MVVRTGGIVPGENSKTGSCMAQCRGVIPERTWSPDTSVFKRWYCGTSCDLLFSFFFPPPFRPGYEDPGYEDDEEVVDEDVKDVRPSNSLD